VHLLYMNNIVFTDSKGVLTLRKDIESSFEGEGLYTGLG
jgi:hypothetical protein